MTRPNRKCAACSKRIVRVRVVVCNGDEAPRHFCRHCAASLRGMPRMTNDGRACVARFVSDWTTYGSAYAIRALDRAAEREHEAQL